jgi:4-hydroxybenzoate polyprenyltransferase/phosphoserine phosphatase
MTEEPKQLVREIPGLTRTVLCVDLDGTLIYTDSFLESFFRLVKQRPDALFWCLLWLMKGRAHLKRKIAERARLNPAELPYNPELLAFLEAERAIGTRIVLATGADQSIAAGVSEHLGLFDEVLASNGTVNFTGTRKSEILTARFGAGRFRYVGNSRADMPVWRSAAEAIVCNANGSVLRRLEREGIPTERVFPQLRNTAALIARALRMYQWPKNLLILVPLFLSHRLGHVDLLLQGLTAMAAFCCCASALYLVNDLLDLPADRAHPRKRLRPFASGKLSLWVGIALAPSLIAIAILLGGLLGADFLVVLAIYASLSTGYSFFVKETALLDVCLLGGLYVVRIFAGGAAMGIQISSWTLGYSMFLFLSLALLKRYVELLMLSSNKQTAARGRGYVVADAPILACFGAAAGCVAALLLALYIESDEVRLLYTHPQRLWLLCGIHFFWVSRVWLLANRGEMHHDPVLFALKDRATYWLGLLAAGIALLAK